MLKQKLVSYCRHENTYAQHNLVLLNEVRECRKVL